MTSEYAQFRQWGYVSDAIARLAHHPLDPVILTAGMTSLPTDPDVEEKAPPAPRVSLLIVCPYYAFFFRALEEGDWRIEMRVTFADRDGDMCVIDPIFLQTKFDASASRVALEILTFVESRGA